VTFLFVTGGQIIFSEIDQFLQSTDRIVGTTQKPRLRGPKSRLRGPKPGIICLVFRFKTGEKTEP